MAATATVLWARVLDRRRADVPSHRVALDPRRTATTAEADLHIRPRLGTNVAVLNGLLRQLIEGGHADRAFIDAHTLGFDELARTVAGYTPERVAEIARIPADQLRQAADMIGRSKMLLSSCLQGVYQSNQGTAAAVQVNNVNLVLGHARTKTGRSGALRDAAPDAFVQMNEDDAHRLGIANGEMLRVTPAAGLRKRRRGSATSGRVPCSCRSITATGTIPAGRARPTN